MEWNDSRPKAWKDEVAALEAEREELTSDWSKALQAKDATIARQAERIAELEAAQRWIPVSEEPKTKIGNADYHETKYIVMVKGCNEPTTRHWREGQTAKYWASWSDERVTHWMPLPTPPIEGNTDER